MKFINIGGSNNDPFYRYKMPKLNLTITRKNGGTTIVNNTTDICESIRRKPTQVIPYLRKSLNMSVSYKRGVWIIRGDCDATRLQQALMDYVKSYVLCGVCGNPETAFLNAKTVQCQSCGSQTSLPTEIRDWDSFQSYVVPRAD